MNVDKYFPRERFVKVNGHVYYESELRLMNDEQLKDLIRQCQDAIDEIAFKKTDYENSNDEKTLHYYEVVSKFKSATVYLQSDIVLLDKILKERLPGNDVNEWYSAFYEICKTSVNGFKFKKLVSMTNETVGFEIK